MSNRDKLNPWFNRQSSFDLFLIKQFLRNHNLIQFDELSVSGFTENNSRELFRERFEHDFKCYQVKYLIPLRHPSKWTEEEPL